MKINNKKRYKTILKLQIYYLLKIKFPKEVGQKIAEELENALIYGIKEGEQYGK